MVSGSVQGVFFRDSCRRAADAAGVAGWVRNRSDGTVEAVFEGPAAAVDQLVEWCRQGPRHARVSVVQTYQEQPTGAHGFRITH
ncbi:MAG: acylphosphatase [Streptosporangiales bacterium]|nr:acylphosphatase [Streptosporangiales bacterium]